MSHEEPQVLKGTLDLMILQSLRHGAVHGYGVVKWIRETTDEAMTIDDGALYPALHRLEARRLIASDWGVSENNRKAKYYHLTRRGAKHLQKEISRWERISQAVWKVVNASE